MPLLRQALELHERLDASRDAARDEASLRSQGVRHGRRGPRKRPQLGWQSLTPTERQVVGLASGVRRTVCWNLAPEIPGYHDHLSVMDLLFGKLALMDYEGTELAHRHPSADAFALVAGQLTGVDSVVRIELPGRPDRYLFEVRRPGRGPCWWYGSCATRSPERTSRRWPSTGPGRPPGRRPSTPWARPSRPRYATAGSSCRSRARRCSSPP